MRFRLIDAKKADLPIERMCALLHVSASGAVSEETGLRRWGGFRNVSG